MSPNELLKAVDHAAGMNDRWLFRSAFCLLLIGGGVVIYWLVRQLQMVLADHKELREVHHKALAQHRLQYDLLNPVGQRLGIDHPGDQKMLFPVARIHRSPFA